jgi:predicted transcriptional regulator
MGKLTEATKTVLDKDLKAKLVARAEEEQRTESAVIRMALAAYLNDNERTK